MSPGYRFTVFILLSLSLSFSAIAQQEKAFYRLNIVNEQGELLLVKIKEPEVWVTTGLYEEPDKFNVAQFHKMAATYGLEISDITFHGDFQLSSAKDKPFQTRYFYQAIASNDVQIAPDFIAETRWVAPAEAFELITFPHISYLTKQTLDHPQQVWSAKIQRYTQAGEHKLQVIEGFHVKPGALSAKAPGK